MFNKMRSVGLAKKREEREVPPFKKSVSRFPACQFALLETIEALRGRTPIHGRLIASMTAMRVNAHHAKRQVYQPGLSSIGAKSF